MLNHERRHYQAAMFDSARWDGFAFRSDDVVICAPQKSGTTWTQMICALVIFGTDQLPGRLGELSPWLDSKTERLETVVAALEAQQHRRIIKTHTPLDGLPYREDITYLCVARDPRDVIVSNYHQWGNVNHEALRAAQLVADGEAGNDWVRRPPFVFDDIHHFFRVWADSPPPSGNPNGSLAGLIANFRTMWAHRRAANVVLVHYRDLEADLEGQMRRIASVLGIDVADGAWPPLVRAARFDAMRSRADEMVPEVHIEGGAWKDNRVFFHTGTTGQWRQLLGAAEVEHYDARLDELRVEPELRAWIHDGSAAAKPVSALHRRDRALR